VTADADADAQSDAHADAVPHRDTDAHAHATPTIRPTGPTPTDVTPTPTDATAATAIADAGTPTATPTATRTATRTPTPTRDRHADADGDRQPDADRDARRGRRRPLQVLQRKEGVRQRGVRRAHGRARDEIETKHTKVVKPTEFCNAVDVQGQGITSPNAHLQCYQIKTRRVRPASSRGPWTVDNEFGLVQPLTLKKVKRVCIPTGSDGVPTTPNLDASSATARRFRRDQPKFAAGASQLHDAFENKTRTCCQPESICNSVDVDDDDSINPAAQLHCYKIQQARGRRVREGDVDADDDFGSQNLLTQKASSCLRAVDSCKPRRLRRRVPGSRGAVRRRRHGGR
jgi:hypothetical protein